ncbi:MAG: hypothetical protein ACRD88_12485, partial [Terriglobia bacterium]
IPEVWRVAVSDGKQEFTGLHARPISSAAAWLSLRASAKPRSGSWKSPAQGGGLEMIEHQKETSISAPGEGKCLLWGRAYPDILSGRLSHE